MNIAIYPNPVKEALTVILPAGTEGQIELLDMQGRVALRQSLSGGVQQLNVSSLTAGHYLYRITKKSSLLASGKLVKQ